MSVIHSPTSPQWPGHNNANLFSLSLTEQLIFPRSHAEQQKHTHTLSHTHSWVDPSQHIMTLWKPYETNKWNEHALFIEPDWEFIGLTETFDWNDSFTRQKKEKERKHCLWEGRRAAEYRSGKSGHLLCYQHTTVVTSRLLYRPYVQLQSDSDQIASQESLMQTTRQHLGEKVKNTSSVESCGGGEISQHNHTAKESVSDRARAAFHRHYSKPEVLYSARQAQPCIMKCKKLCVHEGRGARYSSSGYTLWFWQQHLLDSEATRLQRPEGTQYHQWSICVYISEQNGNDLAHWSSVV